MTSQPAEQNRPYIFVSHSSRDRDMTRPVIEALQQHINLWVDWTQIEPGERWARELQDGVDNCQGLLVLMSRAARESEWVEREVLYAVGNHKPVFIGMIEDVPLPLYLVSRQYSRIETPDADGFAPLVRTLQNLLQQRVALTPVTAASTSAYPTEANFFAYLSQLADGEQASTVAGQLYQWAIEHCEEVAFSGKQRPAFHARTQLGDESLTLFSVIGYLRTPSLQVPLDYWSRHKPYDVSSRRVAFVDRLNQLLPPEDNFEADRADRRPTLPLVEAVGRAAARRDFLRWISEARKAFARAAG